MILIFAKNCIYDENEDTTIIHGYYTSKITDFRIDVMDEADDIYKNVVITLSNRAPDFYIKIPERVTKVKRMAFKLENDERVIITDVELLFPFENCPLMLDSNRSSIISTICKDYSHRLDEWIQYNLRLGFSGIVIFNNDKNVANGLNEPLENCVMTRSMEEICNKYPGKVLLVDCPYTPLPENNNWSNIQRICLTIGTSAFKHKCKYIALIDADEFIHITQNPKIKIEDFLNNIIKSGITMGSNILTNKGDDDGIDNNILDICRYVGEDKYTKTILCTDNIKENEFIVTPHNHPTSISLAKNIITHFHCWVNTRYKYEPSMVRIDYLVLE
jgi:hypothetical protein